MTKVHHLTQPSISTISHKTKSYNHSIIHIHLISTYSLLMTSSVSLQLGWESASFSAHAPAAPIPLSDDKQIQKYQTQSSCRARVICLYRWIPSSHLIPSLTYKINLRQAAVLVDKRSRQRSSPLHSDLVG